MREEFYWEHAEAKRFLSPFSSVDANPKSLHYVTNLLQICDDNSKIQTPRTCCDTCSQSPRLKKGAVEGRLHVTLDLGLNIIV